jgi:hypothetical protein
MEPIAISFIIGVLIGAGIGWIVRSHVHTIVTDTTSAIARATTVPSGIVTAANNAMPGAGTTLQNAAGAVQAPVVAAVNAAGAAVDQPAS